ncbi:MAG: type II toxin-antitoxin system RelB family antitoxin [Enterococcus sp.]
MSTITFRISEDEKNFLEKIAKFNNLSLSDFIRQKAINAAEEQMDFKDYQSMMKEHSENDTSISHADLLSELEF